MNKDNNRFIVDIRGGCGAIRDTKHPKYDPEYPGLHYNTIDVISYIHGFKNSEINSWEMKQENVIMLNELCDKLNNNIDSEYILCSAIWFDDGNVYTCQPINIHIGIVLCGHRHYNIFAQIGGLVKERKDLGIYEKEQGFLTNLNRFVDREEGAKIAFRAKQIENETNRLYSEDLY